MIEKQLKWILSKNLDPNQFFTLMLWELPSLDSKMEGWKFLLEKKGYLDKSKQITQTGEDLIQEYKELSEEKVVTSFNLGVWCEQTIESLQNELVSLGFKKNLKGFGGVPFLPTKVELKSHLERFWKAGYSDYKDYDKIHKCLLEHIKECVKKNSFAPALRYYIWKSGVNTTSLASAYENYEEGQLENQENYDGINI